MMIKKYIFLLLIFSSGTLFAQTRIEKLSKAFDNLLADPQTKNATTSLCVLDAKTGKILFAKNEEIGVATASTLKTITAATAFYILGEDFKYETNLSYSGTITADGTLKGNLIITGSGDPTLGSPRYSNNTESAVLNQWVNAIKNAGIKKIEGKIIGDDSIFGTQTTPEGWVWQDIGNYYGAGTSGLAWRENQFDLNLKPGLAQGDEARILKTSPEMPYLKLVNELKTGATGTGDRAYAFLPPYANLGYIRGTWGLGITKVGISLSVPDPAYDCAYRLQDTLNRLGITLSETATTSRLLTLENQSQPKITKTISTINSPALKDIVYWFLKKSINLYGESLLKSIAIKTAKTPSTAKGINAEVNFWVNKGIDKRGLNIQDGSGLSPGNRITTNAMANILFQIQNENWFGDFYKGLPEYNGMKIKSGSINDVIAYAGYHTDKEGNKYVIVINTNNYNGSGIGKKLFKVLDELK
jgi:D-alanyl-D-alanine carboxypeptidase/D-alanyl-D-alanine-endopeptidase (penicillin-binding protein 4)